MEARNDDVSATTRQEKSETDCAQEGVVGIDGASTTAICADNRGDLPAACQPAVDATGGA